MDGSPGGVKYRAPYRANNGIIMLIMLVRQLEPLWKRYDVQFSFPSVDIAQEGPPQTGFNLNVVAS